MSTSTHNPKSSNKFVINGSSNTISFSIININKQKNELNQNNKNISENNHEEENSTSPKTYIKISKPMPTSGFKDSKLSKFEKSGSKRYRIENSNNSIDKASANNNTNLISES
jgi:hypothetical protein